MVNANELRLGNLVQDRANKIIRIDFWEFEDKVAQRMYLYDKEVHPLTEYVEFLQPIPLTEELLLKCGFERNKTYKRYFYNGISISKYEGEKYFVFDGWRFRAIDIKYLHQLQNLYFILTGEELTINL